MGGRAFRGHAAVASMGVPALRRLDGADRNRSATKPHQVIVQASRKETPVRPTGRGLDGVNLPSDPPRT